MLLELICSVYVELGSTKKHVWTIVIAVLSTLTLLSLGSLAIIFIRRKLKKSHRKDELENSKHHSKSCSITGTSSFQYPLSKGKSEAHKMSSRKGEKQITCLNFNPKCFLMNKN